MTEYYRALQRKAVLPCTSRRGLGGRGLHDCMMHGGALLALPRLVLCGPLEG